MITLIEQIRKEHLETNTKKDQLWEMEIFWQTIKLNTIHLIPKWRPINYSFVHMLISPLGLVNMYKKQKNFEL